ncbi:poly-beta-1,6-N-acetyl-D-glucosamine synthase [Pseudomonas segetis]|uniref:Poly-beta-1,6-N-acetyl-D-glucosamine synthase n=1 Tax=Pseudomonas segetis TaxID=298908 RepID=A0A239I5X4_9PSED|nr:poly-beta-1,6-N-acetyl-D-glucosamine synthase [Pseudomonas segetis]SNS88891.1 biofilm PGA synthesis N-glycosyltransferase PgaC [Pseudomonas segetis]
MIDRLIALIVLAIVIGLPFGLAEGISSAVMLNFIFIYPLLMSMLWIVGGLYFWLHWERHWKWSHDGDNPAPALDGEPLISIIIPCYDEGDNAHETIRAALSQRYPNIEVIAVNDGSKDNTGEVLDQIAAREPRLRVLHLAQNQGKAVALRMGALAANSEYLVCIDGDALLSRDTAAFLVKPLIENPRVGAVTGNPRIRTRSTLVGRIQVGEFSSIIGLIKRAQRVYGRVFTISGVVASFRRSALDRIDYWSPDMITEDIDVSWKLQLDSWTIFYEPRALCWILMPETLAGLWKQRKRWAQGGAEVLLKNIRTIWSWRYRYMWPLLLEFAMSATWAFALALSLVLWLIGQFFEVAPNYRVNDMLPPGFTGVLLASVCLAQFGLSLLIERKYEKGLGQALFWTVWYPLAFWLLTFFTTLVSFPKVMISARGKRARWTSPDRGIKRSEP